MARPLDDILRSIPGVKKVYFEPPTGKRLEFPCIVYSKINKSNEYADNLAYIKHDVYSITVISSDPDDEIPDRLEEAFQFHLSLNRIFDNDDLTHHVYTLYFSGPRYTKKEVEDYGI